MQTHPNITNINQERIRKLICNAYTHETITKLSDLKYDVILDDGPHTHYTPLLADNGILVIEDIQDIAWVEPIRAAFPENVRDKIKVVDRRQVKNRYDDILIILDLSL